MLPAKSRLALAVLGLLAAASPGVLEAQESKANEPATVAEAAAVLDLATFPLMPGGVAKGPRRLANLGYAARSDARGAFAFQKKTLEGLGWKELPGGYLSDASCSGAFGKDGFVVSVSASPAHGAEAEGLAEIRLANHGNVDPSKLPVPPGAKPLYAFPAAIAYVTEVPVKETSEALRKLLTARGWEPYGHAGDSLSFKKNAVKLSAWPSVAPAQGGKTVIQLSTELLSIDLPTPPDPIEAAYADTTTALSLEVDMTSAELAAFYRESLGKAGWKATTDRPVKVDFQDLLIFRNAAKDVMTLKMHDFRGKLRANLEHQTAAEFAEAVRLAEAEEAGRKAESERFAKLAAEEAARNRVTVAIPLPAGAKDARRTKDEVAFKLPAGKARAAVQSIRANLLKQGWKEKGKAKAMEPIAGTVVLDRKADVSLVIIYVDSGFGDAEVTISTFGAEIEGPKGK